MFQLFSHGYGNLFKKRCQWKWPHEDILGATAALEMGTGTRFPKSLPIRGAHLGSVLQNHCSDSFILLLGIKRNANRSTLAPKCSLQPFWDQLQTGSNLNVHQQVNG